jgi:hypothetical protein
MWGTLKDKGHYRKKFLMGKCETILTITKKQ